MSIAEMIQRVQSAYSKGVHSDDSRLTNRHIYNVLISVRQMLISQQVKKKQKISDWNYSILPCVELIEVPSHECSCLADLGCAIIRTKYPLPKPLTDLNIHLISWIFSIDHTVKIEESTREDFLYVKGNKYTSRALKYILENGHAYFPVKGNPGVVAIKLLAEDPVLAYEYPSLCGDCKDCEDCSSILDKDFPIDGDMVKPLIDITAAELLEVFAKGVEDQSNNTADSPKEQSK